MTDRIPRICLLAEEFSLKTEPHFIREHFDKYVIDFPVIDSFVTQSWFSYGQSFNDKNMLEECKRVLRTKLIMAASYAHDGLLFRVLPILEDHDPITGGINLTGRIVIYDIKVEE